MSHSLKGALQESFCGLHVLTPSLLPLALILVCTGCSSPSDKDGIRLSGWVSSPPEEKLLAQTIASFRKIHPEVQVKYEPIPGSYSEKIQLMLGTHTAPDVFYLKGETAPSYMAYDVLLPLNDYMEKDANFDVDDFYPFLRKAFLSDSVYYGFPKDFNPYVLFYNKELFQKANVSRPPQNWQELFDVSARLTVDENQDGKPEQWGLVIEPTIEMLMPFVFQNGGEFHDSEGELKITDEAFIKALEFYYGLYENKVAALPSEVGAAWNGDAFGRQRCAMILAGAWVIPFLSDNHPDVAYGVALLPAGKQRATVAFTNAYSIPKSCRNPKQAWTLLSYLAGKDGMAIWTSLGLAMPSRKSVAKKLGFHEHPVFRYFIESAEFAKVFQVKYVEIWYDASQAALQSVFYLGQSPREAMAELQARISKYKL